MNRDSCIGEIIESLRQSQRAACACLAKSKIKGAAVTPAQWAVLTIVHGSPGISVKELVNTMKVTRSAVTQLANELEEKGYLKRECDKTDKRAINLILTTKCSRMMSDIQKSFMEQCDVMFSGLTDSELKTLSSLQKKIAKTTTN